MRRRRLIKTGARDKNNTIQFPDLSTVPMRFRRHNILCSMQINILVYLYYNILYYHVAYSILLQLLLCFTRFYNLHVWELSINYNYYVIACYYYCIVL